MTGNHFLDTLASEDREAVLRNAVEVELSVGQAVIEQGEVVITVHFPTGARLANITHDDTGEQLQTAVVGTEGLSGLAPFMAASPCAWQVVCSVQGRAWAIPAETLRRLSEDRAGLRRRLLILTHFYQAQANQLALCNTLHSVEQRLARWILTVADHDGGDQLVMTQGQIAADLGVQRTSVVTAFQHAKADGLVRHARGRLSIIDRPRLIARSCGCYRRMRALELELDVFPRPASLVVHSDRADPSTAFQTGQARSRVKATGR